MSICATADPLLAIGDIKGKYVFELHIRTTNCLMANLRNALQYISKGKGEHGQLQVHVAKRVQE